MLATTFVIAHFAVRATKPEMLPSLGMNLDMEQVPVVGRHVAAIHTVIQSWRLGREIGQIERWSKPITQVAWDIVMHPDTIPQVSDRAHSTETSDNALEMYASSTLTIPAAYILRWGARRWQARQERPVIANAP